MTLITTQTMNPKPKRIGPIVKPKRPKGRA